MNPFVEFLKSLGWWLPVFWIVFILVLSYIAAKIEDKINERRKK